LKTRVLYITGRRWPWFFPEEIGCPVEYVEEYEEDNHEEHEGHIELLPESLVLLKPGRSAAS
jgi:hypothetical protein